MRHLLVACLIGISLCQLSLARKLTECEKQCSPGKKLLIDECKAYSRTRPQPKILEVCQTGFRRAFQEGCGKLCQAQEVVSFSARENSAARKAICQKFKAMLPRPSMWNVCIDGFERGMKAGQTTGRRLVAKEEENSYSSERSESGLSSSDSEQQGVDEQINAGATQDQPSSKGNHNLKEAEKNNDISKDDEPVEEKKTKNSEKPKHPPTVKEQKEPTQNKEIPKDDQTVEEKDPKEKPQNGGHPPSENGERGQNGSTQNKEGESPEGKTPEGNDNRGKDQPKEATNQHTHTGSTQKSNAQVSNKVSGGKEAKAETKVPETQTTKSEEAQANQPQSDMQNTNSKGETKSESSINLENDAASSEVNDHSEEESKK